jgi:hypothetical protein
MSQWYGKKPSPKWVVPMDLAGLIAILGLIVTTIVAVSQQFLTVRQMQRASWRDSLNQLASEQAAERAAGMAVAIDYLNDSKLRTQTLRVALQRLHYEDDPLIVYRALEALSDRRFLKPAIEELLEINRHTWRYLLEEFARTCRDPNYSSTGRDLTSYLEQLHRNQRSTSYLLQQGESFEKLDLSNTFYPNLQAPRVRFTRCYFGSSLLHYSNLYRAGFISCDLRRCILIGSYLEQADLPERTDDGYVDHAARYHRKRGDKLPSSTPPSFLWEYEEGWYGHWEERVGTGTRVFDAKWPIPSDKTKTASGSQEPEYLKATIFLEGENGSFSRKESDNDGSYEMTSSIMLDSIRGVVLVGGTRELEERVRSPWWAVWWQQLRPILADNAHHRT